MTSIRGHFVEIALPFILARAPTLLVLFLLMLSSHATAREDQVDGALAALSIQGQSITIEGQNITVQGENITVQNQPVEVQNQDQAKWQLASSVGMVVSQVVSPNFTIVGEGEDRRVIRAFQTEDDRAIKLVPFAHFVRDREERTEQHLTTGWAFAGGVGQFTTEVVDVYAGFGYHFGHNLYVSLGYNWRTVETLPVDQELDKPPIRPDILAKLPTRVETGFFFAFTYALTDPHRSGNSQ